MIGDFTVTDMMQRQMVIANYGPAEFMKANLKPEPRGTVPYDISRT
jgi:hypothetical protein